MLSEWNFDEEDLKYLLSVPAFSDALLNETPLIIAARLGEKANKRLPMLRQLRAEASFNRVPQKVLEFFEKKQIRLALEAEMALELALKK
jgi:hypothetical protein